MHIRLFIDSLSKTPVEQNFAGARDKKEIESIGEIAISLQIKIYSTSNMIMDV
jgi:hypothetical protein